MKPIATGPRILIVLFNNMGSITSRIRGLIFSDLFREIGWTVEFIDIEETTEDLLVERAIGFDAVYLLKIPYLSLIHKLRATTTAKIIFDLTDALWMPHHRWNGWQDLEAILTAVDAVFSDNEFVAAYGRRYNGDVHVIPACTQVERFAEIRKTLAPRTDDDVVVGWVGTASTMTALDVVREPLERLSLKYPKLSLRLLILGLSDMNAPSGFRHTRHTVLPSYDEDRMIREVLRMDIGIFPPPCGLEDYAIRGPLKALIYMTGGVAPVCQDAGVCATLIQDGTNGMLANNADEWERKLEALIASPDLRRRIGQNALRTVERNHSLKAIFERLVAALQSVLASPPSAGISVASIDTAGAAPRRSSAKGAAKKILIACSHFWPSVGGIENRLEQFSAALVREGYDVSIMTPDFPGRDSNTRNGVSIVSIDATAVRNGVPEWPNAVRNAVSSGDYDACILVQDPLGTILWSVEGVVPPPSTRLILQPIINADGYGKWKGHAEFRTRLAAILRSANVAVALTKSGPDIQFMRTEGIAPAYLPNASSVPEPAGDFRQRYGIPKDRFMVLHVANLYWVKNHCGLLDALNDLPDSWQLVMVGKPTGEPDCAKAVMDKLAQRPEVLYIPGLSREWVSAAMKAADVIVLSSFGEGSPNTILEAMAQGKPWLATPQCGAANDNAGGVICTLDGFRRHLAVLNANPEIRLELGEIGHRHWQESYSWDTVVKGWIDIIETGTTARTFALPENIERLNRTLVDKVISAAKGVSTFPESPLAHKWLDGLKGLEVGPSSHNPFGLNTRYVGIQDDIYEAEQLKMTGYATPLDIVARADEIPVADESEDFVLTSHVIEHCPNFIKTLLEWYRIIRRGGYLFMIVPHRNAAPSDAGRPVTDWHHHLNDFLNQATEAMEPEAGNFGHCHYHVFDYHLTQEFIRTIFGDRLVLVDAQPVDDKIGNGFTLVYQKTRSPEESLPWDYWDYFIAHRTIDKEADSLPLGTRFVNIGMITYNRLEFTRQSIESIVRYVDFPHTLTVVDNNSHDGTREYLTELKARGIIKNLVLLDDNVGVAKAANLAWALEPHADYYLKLDNDIVIKKAGWLAAMVETIDRLPQAGAVAYNFEPTSYPLQAINGCRVRIKPEGNLGGACILIPRRTHEKLGFWCEDYGLYGEEDYDYGIRIRLAGLENTYLEDEEIGFHLPAGRAAVIDTRTFQAGDGVEEELHADYRAWKDEARRKTMANGILQRNLDAYRSGSRSLHTSSAFAAAWAARATATGSAPSPKLKVAVYSLEHHSFACAQLRILAPSHAAADGVELRWAVTTENNQASIDTSVTAWADVVLVQRFFPREETWPFIEKITASGKPIIYETDDFFLDLPLTNPHRGLVEASKPWILKTITKAAAVTVSTEEMKRAFASHHRQIHVLPNLLEDRLWTVPLPAKPAGTPVVIGYAGTPDHKADLRLLEEVLERIAAKYGSRVAFRFMGCDTERIKGLPGFSSITFEPGYANYARTIQKAGIDIGLVPLEDNRFNRCKSNIKWLEYSACGIAGIYADLPPYRSCVKDGETGLLVAGYDVDAWVAAIESLIDNPDRRHAMALAARTEVLATYTLKSRGRLFLDTWRRIAGPNDTTAKEQEMTIAPQPFAPAAAVTGADAPKVSIIIPLYNKVEYTKQCLEALALNTDQTLGYEVILVDNASSDGTADYLRTLSGEVTIVTNLKNLGFAKACNQGGRIARGRYLVFLNNDTIPHPGWLDGLIKGAERDGADIVGAKLLYPTGRAQHAGVAFNEQSIGYHIFNGFTADAPAVNRKRFMQCVTAACMLMTRELFAELGGFDEVYVNGFEDVDLCLRAGERGRRILYTPESVLIHFEETSEGRKAHDEPNIRRFLSRWQGKVRCDDQEFYRVEGFRTEKMPDGRLRIFAAPEAPAPPRPAQPVPPPPAPAAPSRSAVPPAADRETALALKSEGRFVEALDVLSKILTRGDRSVLVDAADCLAALDKHDDALALYGEALAAAPADARAHVGIGIVKLLTGKLSEASGAFTRALEREPANPKALCGLGLARNAQERHGEAFDLFCKALEADPENLTALHELVKLAYALERFTETARHLETYLMYHPGDTDMLFSHAGILYMANEPQRAREAVERLLALSPGYEGGGELLAKLGEERGVRSEGGAVQLKEEGKFAEAFEEFSRARERGDNTVVADMGDCLANLGRLDDAAALYQEAVQLNPEDTKALVGLGVVSMIQEKQVKAVTWFNKALKADPASTKALCGLGMVRNMQSKHNKAFDCFARAIDTDQENLTALHELAKCAYITGRFAEAAEKLNAYLAYHPADLDMLYSLAGIQFKGGRAADALESVEKVLLFAPDYEGGKELSERIRESMAA